MATEVQDEAAAMEVTLQANASLAYLKAKDWREAAQKATAALKQDPVRGGLARGSLGGRLRLRRMVSAMVALVKGHVCVRVCCAAASLLIGASCCLISI
jgi:hypothetical protein